MDKKKLSESDICDKFIRPAMEQAGWHGLDQIDREFLLRARRVSVRGNKAHRDQSTVLSTSRRQVAAYGGEVEDGVYGVGWLIKP